MAPVQRLKQCETAVKTVKRRFLIEIDRLLIRRVLPPPSGLARCGHRPAREVHPLGVPEGLRFNLTGNATDFRATDLSLSGRTLCRPIEWALRALFRMLLQLAVPCS